jgi:hypothetical protein
MVIIYLSKITNPFDRPVTKQMGNVTKAPLKTGMQKLDNFRDQLNKQIFGEIDNPNEKGNIIEEIPKTSGYKVPPKIFKKPDLTIDTNNNSNIANQPIPINPLSKSSDRDLNEIFASNSKEVTQNYKTQKEKENNISFSEENCNSVVYSENKDSKRDKSDSSNEKMIKQPQLDNLSNNNSTSELNNSININNHMQKIEKKTKFTRKSNANNTKTVKPEPIINSPIITKYDSKIESKPKEVEKDTFSIKSYKSSTMSIKNSQNMKEESVNEELNHINEDIHNNLISSMSSSELNKKLEKLKGEIIDLKQSKSSVEANYEIEVKRNGMYKEEVDKLRKTLTDFKAKQLKESDSMLKLEINNLKNNLEFKVKENELLCKENESLKRELDKMQKYISGILEDKKKHITSNANDKPLKKEEERKEIISSIFKSNDNDKIINNDLLNKQRSPYTKEKENERKNSHHSNKEDNIRKNSINNNNEQRVRKNSYNNNEMDILDIKTAKEEIPIENKEIIDEDNYNKLQIVEDENIQLIQEIKKEGNVQLNNFEEKNFISTEIKEDNTNSYQTLKDNINTIQVEKELKQLKEVRHQVPFDIPKVNNRILNM